MDKIVITCPYCGYGEEIEKVEALQTHRCSRCKRAITARKTEHCVICSYGSEKCGHENKNSF